ncbi:MAG: NADPH-dependent FMN reductase [Nocardioides sp.]
MTDLAVVVGSTRPGRVGEQVAHWVLERAQARTDATFSLVDLAEVDLPPLDEPLPPASGRYSHPWTVAWAQTVDRYDGFLFVTPEYNRGMPGSLKNALDRVCAEWHDKAAAFVSYGHGGGVRAVEQLRQVVGALRLADVSASVALDLRADVDEARALAPAAQQAVALDRTLDQLVAWSGALAGLRAHRAEGARS